MPPTNSLDPSRPTLLQSLRGIRLKVKLFSFLFGVGLVLAAAIGLLLATVLLDYLLNMAVWPRMVLIAATIAAVAYTFWNYLARPLFSRLSIGDVAGHLENAFPQFEDRLRSTVDFIRPEVPGSPIMKRFVVAQADQLASSVNLDRALVKRPVLYALGGGFVAIAILAALAISYPGLARIAVSRLLMVHAQPWPKSVEIDVLGKIPAKVTEGQPVELTMRLTKGDRRGMRAYVYVEYDSGATHRQAMERDADGKYSAVIQAKGTVMNWWMEAGDDSTQRQSIVVVPPLLIKSVEATVIPPPYARRLPMLLEAMPGYLHDAFPAEMAQNVTTYRLGRSPLPITNGSVVLLNLTFNKPLLPGHSVRIEPAEKNVMPAGFQWLDPRSVDARQARWTLTQSLRFRVHGIDADELPNATSDEYSLGVREDQLPTVEITSPAADEERTPQAFVNLEAVARDDSGISTMTLLVDRLGDKKHWEIPFAPDGDFKLVESSSERRSYLLKYKWELAELAGAQLKPDDVLQFVVRVTDNYRYSGTTHPPVLSTPRKIKIISQEELTRQATVDLQKAYDRTQAAQNSQNRTKQETSDVRKDVLNKPQTDPTDRTAMMRLSDQQSMLAAQTKRLAENVGNIEKRLEENRSNNQDLKDISQDTKTMLNQAAENAMAEAQKKLSEAAHHADPQNAKNNPNAPQQRDQALEKSEGKQQEASEQLGQVMERLSKLQQLENAINRVREALNKQQESSKKLSELGKETIGKERNQLTEDQKKKLDELANDQKKQSENTEKLTADLKKSAEQTQKSDPSASEAMSKAAQQSQQQQVSSKQAQAAQQAQQNQQANAQAQQKQAELGLQMMLDSLREAQRRKLEKLSRDLAKLQELVADLIRRQAGHNIDNLRIQAIADALKQITDELLLKADRARDAQPAAPSRDGLTRSQIQTEGNSRDVAKTAEALPKGGAEIAATLARAAGHMERAIVMLKGNTLPEAYDPNQVKALAALEEAKQKVDKAAADVNEQIDEANRETIRQAYEKIRAEQELINKETTRIDGAQRLPDGSFKREDAVALRGLPETQNKLAERTQKLEESLSSLGSIVYVWANKDIVSSMNEVKTDLAKPTTGQPTQIEEARILEQLDVMIKSLATKPKMTDFYGQGGGGGGAPKPKMPSEAELRLLKGLQLAINKATKLLHNQEKPDQPKLVSVGNRQGELRNLLDELIKKASDNQVKLDPEPNPKDRLPEESSKKDIENQEFDEWLRGGRPGDDQLADDVKMAGQRMGRSRQRLALDKDPGKVTQAIQERIIINLDHLIQMAQAQMMQTNSQANSRRPQQGDQAKLGQGKMGQQDSGASQPNRGSSPATAERGGGTANNTADTSKDIRETAAEWGKLTPKERRAVIDGMNDHSLPKYKQLIEDYYEMMSKRGSKTP